ncbi:hypothetical protein WMY93_016497 [Mugilogobius chulae]|uniref:C-type lectin domain-containing protein n=1 Tax=Mugilogobius chulae TaxID=88201 RepID=A0AAW0NQF7_9GOBI
MDSESDQNMPPEQRITEDLNTSRSSHFQHQKRRKGTLFGLPQYRVVLLCLSLLDTALLITALVLGMYCAKAKDLQQVTDSAFAPLVIERNFLRNHTDVIKEKLATQVELESQRRAHMQLKVQIKQQQVISDSLQKNILVMKTEKAQLEANKTALETNCGRCPSGWIFLKTSCYYYSMPPSNAKKNWADSRADCNNRGGDLLVINNLEEQKAINNNYPKMTGTGPQWKMGFWIGLSHSVSKGAWVWVNNATEDNTMYWETGQPGSEERLVRHCAAFGRNILSWKSWYNRNCEQDELNWICEMVPRTYNKLTCPEDSSDDLPLTTNQDEQQVALSMVRPNSLHNHRKVLTVMLSVLAAILLSIDIGLCIYYRNLTDAERIIKDINSEVAKLQQAYKIAINTKIELKKELAKEASLQQLTKWELDHHKSRNQDYQQELDKIHLLITGLKSHIPLLEEGCRHCLPGWNLINSFCYYIPFSENTPRRSWDQSRDYCRNFGADLIEINNKEKQLAIINLITTYHDSSVQYSSSGFWIGARDVEEEGVWKWLDGTQIIQGFWNIGEPNNMGNEDCAAVYPTPNKNPFMSWNDAPCNHFLKWICEKAPGLAKTA